MDINIYEVGPRDGLQNSKFKVSTLNKINMIRELHYAGLKNIEATSFVHPKRVPNLSDAEEVFSQTKELGDLGVLVPNQRGFDRAMEVGAKKINVFFSPSNEFNFRNLGKKLDEVYGNLKTMLNDTDRENVRAYISCAFGCPFEGLPSEHKLKDAISKASDIAETVVLCDTIGEAYPTKIAKTVQLTKNIDSKIAMHFHEKKIGGNDIFNNVKTSLDMGVDSFDSSINGLGGCPFIPNSGNNLSTNQLVNWAHNNGYETGIKPKDLSYVTQFVRSLERENRIIPEGFITEAKPVIE
jgi:hydroxymethylglutaryl-CoA lyase